MKKTVIIPDEKQALERIAARCAKSELCESDVRRKLSEWEQPAEVADRIVAYLRAEKFIDDERYCRAFVEDKWNINHWGKTKIRMTLQLKGMRGEVVARALNAIDNDEYRAVLHFLLNAKSSTLRSASRYELYQKLLRYAVGRGFEPDAIKECLTFDDNL